MLGGFGAAIPVGAHDVVPNVRELLAESAAVPPLLHTTLAGACDEIAVLEPNMRAIERQLGALACDMADVSLLQTVPGVSPITVSGARRARQPHPPLSFRTACRQFSV